MPARPELSLLKRLRTFRDVERALEDSIVTQTFILPNTPYTIKHGLKHEPFGWHWIDKDRPAQIWKESANNTDLVLLCDTSNVVAKIKIF